MMAVLVVVASGIVILISYASIKSMKKNGAEDKLTELEKERARETAKSMTTKSGMPLF